MSDMNKIIGKNEIENFFKTLAQGKIIWIKVHKGRPHNPTAFFAVFENYGQDERHCIITLGPWGSKMLFLDQIDEVAIVQTSSLVAAINSILKLSESYF